MSTEDHGYTLLRWVLGTRGAYTAVSDEEARVAAVEIVRNTGGLAAVGADRGEGVDAWASRVWPAVAARVRHDGPAVARMLDREDVPTTSSTGRTLAPAERVHYLAVALDDAEGRAAAFDSENLELRQELRRARETELALRRLRARELDLAESLRHLADAHRDRAETLATLLEECRSRREEDREARHAADEDLLTSVGVAP